MLIACEEHHSSGAAHLPSPNPTASFWHNEPSTFLHHHRTTPELPKIADAVIIGSGISGTFAALKFTEEHGINVVMLEAREACWGATGRNGGHCQPLLYENSADVAAFQLRNFKFIEALIVEHNIPCEWQAMPGGGCHSYFSRKYFEEAKAEVEALAHNDRELAETVRVVEDKEDLKRLRIPNAAGAILQQYAAKLSPYKLISWILESLIKDSKLNLQTSTPVLSLIPSDSTFQHGWTIHTSRGPVTAKSVLLTTNGYTSHLLPQFEGLIVPVRGEMSALKAPQRLIQQPLSHTYGFIGTVGQVRIQDDYLIQRPVSAGGEGGELMFGGGRWKAWHEGVNVDNDETIDAPVAAYLRSRLLHVLEMESSVAIPTETPNSEEELVAKKEWTGVMGFSRDGHPWVGAVPGSKGLWLAAAYTGSGMPNAALSSRYAASLIIAAGKGMDDQVLEQIAISSGDIPSSYLITEERMKRARKLPEIL